MFFPLFLLETGWHISDAQKFSYAGLFNQFYIGWSSTSQTSLNHPLCPLLTEDHRWMPQTEQERSVPNDLMPCMEYWSPVLLAEMKQNRNP